jgi:hypothetical protein
MARTGVESGLSGKRKKIMTLGKMSPDIFPQTSGREEE